MLEGVGLPRSMVRLYLISLPEWLQVVVCDSLPRLFVCQVYAVILEEILVRYTNTACAARAHKVCTPEDQPDMRNADQPTHFILKRHRTHSWSSILLPF